MTDVEMFLRDHWHARRSVGRLMNELTLARQAYEDRASNVATAGVLMRPGGKGYGGTSSVERAAVLMVDQLAAEVKSIEQRLGAERRTLARIERVVAAAALSCQEAQYVRLRYFENKSVQATSQRLFCSPATSWRIKLAALKKIGDVLDSGEAADAEHEQDEDKAWHEAANEA